MGVVDYQRIEHGYTFDVGNVVDFSEGGKTGVVTFTVLLVELLHSVLLSLHQVVQIICGILIQWIVIDLVLDVGNVLLKLLGGFILGVSHGKDIVTFQVVLGDHVLFHVPRGLAKDLDKVVDGLQKGLIHVILEIFRLGTADAVTGVLLGIGVFPVLKLLTGSLFQDGLLEVADIDHAVLPCLTDLHLLVLGHIVVDLPGRVVVLDGISEHQARVYASGNFLGLVEKGLRLIFCNF